MPYYQEVVLDYLRMDRAVFVNPECCIQLFDESNPSPGTHWFCDAVAIDLRNKTVFLCEVSYAKGLRALRKRLQEWAQHWTDLQKGIQRDCMVNPEWAVRPWLFVPEESVEDLATKLPSVFQPRITPLECVQPWKFGWQHRDSDTPKPDFIPAKMRV